MLSDVPLVSRKYLCACRCMHVDACMYTCCKVLCLYTCSVMCLLYLESIFVHVDALLCCKLLCVCVCVRVYVSVRVCNTMCALYCIVCIGWYCRLVMSCLRSMATTLGTCSTLTPSLSSNTVETLSSSLSGGYRRSPSSEVHTLVHTPPHTHMH